VSRQAFPGIRVRASNKFVEDEVGVIMKAISTSETYIKDKNHEGREYRCVFCLAFLMFLWIAAFSRLLPRSVRPLASATSRKETFWQEAKRAAETATGYAFMR
jgi:hypothetical protein